ncbi:uncharacterized protein KY384_008174 [Bacidia gigantensis]|uniref:uncharacterized protein n=1 Tax=Bacidia gigantensis TaxID=2732470 RepID=UPI001D048239|nr:uncharacterized protein KY384_008174 [Bacidia gigantensis]KAG8526745.1 hypothetical protein KY384_008174 [Bacidia gigantensis]
MSTPGEASSPTGVHSATTAADGRPAASRSQPTQLDADIWIELFSFVPARADRLALYSVSRDLRCWLEPHMWRKTTITVSEERGNNKLPHSEAPASLCHHVRHLEVVAPFVKQLSKRCVRPSFGEYSKEYHMKTLPTVNDPQTNPFRASWLGLDLIPLLEKIPQDQLLTFKFDLGICVPKEIFANDSPLITRQAKIREISLITAADCSFVTHANKARYTDISLLKSLTKLSWQGIRLAKEVFSIRRTLEANHEHLQELLIEMAWVDIYHWKLWDIRHGRPKESRARRTSVYGIEAMRRPLFALHSLSLRKYHFHSGYDFLLACIDVTRLKSLSLRECSEEDRLITPAIDQGKMLQLENLEWDIESLDLLGDVICASRGLRSLFGGPVVDDDLEIFDVDEALQRLFRCEIECFGLSISSTLPLLGKLIDLGPPVPSWKVLHLRRSACNPEHGTRDSLLKAFEYCDRMRQQGEDTCIYDVVEQGASLEEYCLWNLVQFAFGETGLPKLQVLAYGDFSHGRRHESRGLIFIRKRPYNSQLSNMDEASAFTEVEDLAEFLAACPKDQLVPKAEHRYMVEPGIITQR